jgi:hypothetical protein
MYLIAILSEHFTSEADEVSLNIVQSVPSSHDVIAQPNT